MEQDNIPDIIVSDIDMPEMDGFTLLKNLKSSSIFEDIPFIILSSIDNSAEKIRCLKMGADDYVVKPFNPEELEARIANIIRRKERYVK